MEITFEKAVTIISAILNFLALVVIFFTLLEMKIQRNSQYKPTVIFEREDFLLSTADFVEDTNIEKGNKILEHFDGMTLTLKNIGSFPARDIMVSVKKKNIESIKKKYSYIDLSMLNEDDNGIYVIHESENSTCYMEPEACRMFPYLLGNGQNEVQVYIPGIYTYILEQVLIKNDYKYDIKNFIIITDIEYSDIAKKRYFEEARLYIDLDYIKRTSEGSGETSFAISMVKRSN